MRRYVTVAALFFVPALIFSGLALASNLADPSRVDDETSAAVEDLNAQARAVAMTAVEDWLQGEPSPLPGGQIVTWDRYRPVTAVATPEEDDDNPVETLQTHSLSVTANGSHYLAQVQVAVSPTNGARVLATPSLTPIVPAVDGFTGAPWPGAQDAPVSDDVPEAVTQWANAFIGGTPSQLRLAVGDPDTGHAYMPIVGANVQSATVEATTVQPHQLDSEGRMPDSPSQVIGRVTVAVRWGAPDAEPEDGAAEAATLTYDVLIDGASTASPRIVAWGGPGTGPDLMPFANAISGRDIRIEPTQPAGPVDDENTDEPDPAHEEATS